MMVIEWQRRDTKTAECFVGAGPNFPIFVAPRLVDTTVTSGEHLRERQKYRIVEVSTELHCLLRDPNAVVGIYKTIRQNETSHRIYLGRLETGLRCPGRLSFVSVRRLLHFAAPVLSVNNEFKETRFG